jgi:hypothetical protein
MLHTHVSSAAGTIGQTVADVPSGLSLTPPHEELKKKIIIIIIIILVYTGATRQRSWLRHYVTSRKAVGSIPDEVIGFFN